MGNFAFSQCIKETERSRQVWYRSADYLAPEIIKGEEVSEAADWWSLGVILYELTAGRNPFRGSTEEDTRSNVMNWKKIVQRIMQCEYMATETLDLLHKLLRGPPEYKPCTIEDIRGSKFFSEVDMDDLMSELVEY